MSDWHTAQVAQHAQHVLHGSPEGILTSHALSIFKTSSRPQQPFSGGLAGCTPLNGNGFNLCFLDAFIAVYALCGLFFGAIALVLLLRSEVQKPLFRTWNHYARFVIIVPLLGATAAQAITLLIRSPSQSVHDIAFWSPVALFSSILVIAGVQYIENRRSRVPIAVVLIYWLFLPIIYLVKTLSLPPRSFRFDIPGSYALSPIITALAVMEFCLEWLIPSLMRPKTVVGEGSENPRITADIFSEIFFTWLTPFMEHGYGNIIKEKDLYPLRDADSARNTYPRFQKAWDVEEKKANPHLWLPIFKAFGSEWLWPVILETTGRALGLVQPIILQYFIRWVASRSTSDPQPYAWGIALAVLMLDSSALTTLCLQQSSQRFIESASRVKVALQAQLYHKSIHLSSSAKKDMNVGDIVTRMAADCQKIWMTVRLAPWIWSAPLELIFSMVLLYRFLGWSMLAGVAVMVFISPLNALTVVFNQKFEKQQMEAKDKRTRLITEIVENMKTIKLYAWANAYLIKLRGVRNDEELNAMRKERFLSAGFNIVFGLPRFLIAATTFAVFSYVSPVPLTSDVIFPALALFNILNFSLGIFPMLVNIYVEGRVASERLVEMYTSEQLQLDAVEKKTRGEEEDAELVTVSSASFSPSSKEEKVLVKINEFSARAGELNCIIGQVGSGKSSFLNAILGNLHKTQGSVSVAGRIAYVPQTAWVMNATIKENICFGRLFNGELYNKTLKNCALLPDLASLQDGDQTEVGEKGISLSGGQKARLSLARAVYSQADVYIMDDCLSAVDEHVSKALIENVIGPNGMLRSAARILATNSTRVLNSANTIYYLQDGAVKESGPYEELMSRQGSMYDLVNTLVEQQQQNGDSSGSDSKTPLITIAEAESSSSAESTNPTQTLSTEIEEALVKASEVTLVSGAGEAVKPSVVLADGDVDETLPLLTAGTTADVSGKDPIVAAEEGSDPLAQRKVEKSAEGKVSWNAYLAYGKACRPWMVLLWFVAMFGEQAMGLVAGLWIKHWSDLNDTHGGNYQAGKYLGIYTAIGGIVCLFGCAESVISFVVCGIAASKTMHDRMAQAIFRAPMSFFETTPAGQITNRFSTDINALDSMVRAFIGVFSTSAVVLLTLGIVTWTTPFFLVLIVPLALICRSLQQYYIRTSRELARMESATKSPIFSHFQESLGGFSSIRAYGREDAFIGENVNRLDANLRAYYAFTTSNRWVILRLELIASVVVGGAACLAVAAIGAGYATSAGAVGLAMSYALQVAENLSFLVRMTVDIENAMVSVERILEYSNLPAEAEDVVAERRPPQDWPQFGAVEFNDYSVRYREGLPLTLKNINLDIKAGERVGIVGRTGAGKSTLTLALFRLIEPSSGHVSIDEINTSRLGLYDLRSNLAIIPQDAAIIQGTLRTNLDPGNKHSDETLWHALEHAQLKDHVNTMEDKLDAKLDEGGSNLSQGQRQLVSLARALLTSSKVLVLDEATSAVDHVTDKLVQETLRSDVFAKRTIITIAHRINTIADSDRVVVLDAGKVIEFDTPAELVRKGGLFRDLVQEAGLIGMFEQN